MIVDVSDRLVNLLGVLAVGVSDRMRSALAGAMPLGGQTVSSVIVIGHAPTISIDQLSRILRLTHGGAARLVDRLVERNIVDKQPSAIDRRIMTLRLTPSGLPLRGKLLALRRDALASLLGCVSPEDLSTLERIAATIVASLPEDALSALAACRYCDERKCLDCPMDVFGPFETPGGLTSRGGVLALEVNRETERKTEKQ